MEFVNQNPKIYLLSGKAKSGKDMAGKIIEEFYRDKKVIKLSFSQPLKEYSKKILGWDGNEETKPREFLQNLGIKLIHNKIDPHFLIRRLCEDITILSYFYEVIIITDARLIGEIETIKSSFPNSTVIRIERKNYENGLTEKQQNHLTEIELDHYQNYDYVVENQGNKEVFEQAMKEIIERTDQSA